MKLDLPKFETEKQMLDYIVANEQTIIAQSKMQIKEADGLGMPPTLLFGFGDKPTSKEEGEINLAEKDSIKAKLAINTTNVIDSHQDLHVSGLWDKSLKENKRILHLQEHSRKFKDVISKGNDLKAYTEEKSWKDLGFDMDGKTEVLTFDSTIRKSVNTYMFDQYAKGMVEEHSVGMMYVKIVTCINDEEYPVQKENWDKYFPLAANKDSFTGKVFWAVLEAKAIEGSAVLLGSNSFTPTQEIKALEFEEPRQTKEEIEKQALIDWLKK